MHRADKNQNQIVRELRELGYSVLILSQVGNGCPDILVSRNSKNILFEIKTKTGKLRKSQKDFLEKWRGEAYVARTTEDIINKFAEMD
jgi:Holliday junction resolvase